MLKKHALNAEIIEDIHLHLHYSPTNSKTYQMPKECI